MAHNCPGRMRRHLRSWRKRHRVPGVSVGQPTGQSTHDDIRGRRFFCCCGTTTNTFWRHGPRKGYHPHRQSCCSWRSGPIADPVISSASSKPKADTASRPRQVTGLSSRSACIKHRSPGSPTPNAGRPGAPNNATPEAEKSPGCKGVRWRIHNRRSTTHNQTRNTVRSSSDNRSHRIHSPTRSMVRSRLESCCRCSTTQRRNQRRLRKLHRDMRDDIPFVERLQRSTPFAVVLYGHQRCPTITRQCSVTGEARRAQQSVTRHHR